MANYPITYLYSRYASDCIEQEEYQTLVNLGVLPDKNSLKFPAVPSVRPSDGPANFSGAAVDVLAGRGELLFLENWLGCDKQGMYLHESIYVFKDFLVISGEPDYDDKTGSFGRTYDVDPIAIPISRVLEVKTDDIADYQHTYRLVLTLDSGNKLAGRLFWFNPFWNNFVFDNWTVAVNAKIQKGNLGKGADISNALCARMKSILRNATDYEGRKEAITALFQEEAVSQLMKSVYLSNADFARAICQNKDFLECENKDALRNGDKASKLKRVIEQIEEKEKAVVSELESARKELADCNSAITAATTGLQTAGLFKKGKLKKEIQSLSGKKTALEDQISRLDPFENMQSMILGCINGAIISKERREKGKQLYAECKKRGLTKIRFDSDKTLLEMICKKLDINVSQGEELLAIGKQIEESKNSNSDSNRLTRIKLTNQHKQEQAQASIIGLDKYLGKHYESIVAKQEELKELGISYNLGIDYASKAKAAKLDWAIAGGIADAIAGPGAGISVAIDTQIQNAKSTAAAENARRDGVLLAAYSSALAKKKEAELKGVLDEVEKLKRTICDTEHGKDFFDYLSFKVLEHSVITDNAMKVTVMVSHKKSMFFNGLPISIDGSVIVQVLLNSTVIGTAYVCGDGFNSTNFGFVGFKNGKKYEAIALASKGQQFKPGNNYSFNIIANHIWMIER